MTGDVTGRELQSQPEVWARLFSRLEAGHFALPFDLSDYDEVLLLGSGTSYYIALAVADWLRRRGHQARGVASCEILLDPFETRTSTLRRLAVGFSRSGRSTELILANERLAQAGFTVAGVSCTEGSDLLKQVRFGLLVTEGHEDGLIMLRSMTSMLITAQWLFGTAEDRRALGTLPEAGRAILRNYEAGLNSLAQSRDFDRFVFLGSGPDYPLALESALKVQEMAISTSEAYYPLEYRHGPKACANEDTLVTIFAPPDVGHGVALARDMRTLGASVLVIGTGTEHYDGIAQLSVPLPASLDGGRGAAAALLPVQTFAFATALRRGRNPDAPVNLSKVVIF